MRKTKGLILAAGYGTRLAPWTDQLPKPLFPVLNRPIIFHVIDRLREAGITEIAINVHHLADEIMNSLGNGSEFGVQITWFREETLLGTGGILKRSADFWNGADLLITASDMLSTLDLTALLSFHRAHAGDSTVACFEHQWPPDEWSGDVAVLEPNSHSVMEYQSKPGINAGSRFACTGTWVLSPTAAQALPDEITFDINKDVMPRLAERRTLYGFVSDYEFADMGRPSIYLLGTALALEGKLGISPSEPECNDGLFVHPTATVAPTARLTRPTVIGPEAVIEDGCLLIGPVVIGGGCVIGQNTVLRDSVILPGTAIPANLVISNALLGDVEKTVPAIRRYHLH